MKRELLFCSLFMMVMISVASIVASPVDMKRPLPVAERQAADSILASPVYMSDDAFAASVAAAKNFDEFKAAYAKKHASDKMKAEKVTKAKAESK